MKMYMYDFVHMQYIYSKEKFIKEEWESRSLLILLAKHTRERSYMPYVSNSQYSNQYITQGRGRKKSSLTLHGYQNNYKMHPSTSWCGSLFPWKLNAQAPDVTTYSRLSVLSVLPELPCFNDAEIILHSEFKSSSDRLWLWEIREAKYSADPLDNEVNWHLAQFTQILFFDKEICARANEHNLSRYNGFSLHSVRLLRRARSRRHVQYLEIHWAVILLPDDYREVQFAGLL